MDAGGVHYEGEEAPQQTPEESLAFMAWNALSNGMGGVDWSGFGLVCDWLGVDDPDRLAHQILAIKTHKRPEEADTEDED